MSSYELEGDDLLMAEMGFVDDEGQHTTPAQAGETESTMDFTTLRAEWKAAGCPIDHPYLTMELPVSPIVPLLDGITPEMVTAAASMKFVERPL